MIKVCKLLSKIFGYEWKRNIMPFLKRSLLTYQFFKGILNYIIENFKHANFGFKY